MPEITYTQTLRTVTCWCGVAFAIPSNMYRHVVEEGDGNCHCPLGHSVSWNGGWKERYERETAARERAEQRARATRDLLEAEQRSHAATRGVVTKQRKKLHRVTHGVCPCCNRTFQNLARHMETQHPDYDAALAAATDADA